MTREEAINVLMNEKECVLRETCERLECASCELVMPVGNILSAYDIAIDVLREQEERENPKPLTLDELREMDGEPVWIRAKHYGIYADIVNIMGKEDGERRVHFSINYRLQENGCGKTWLAYRNKPKEDEL